MYGETFRFYRSSRSTVTPKLTRQSIFRFDRVKNSTLSQTDRQKWRQDREDDEDEEDEGYDSDEEVNPTDRQSDFLGSLSKPKKEIYREVIKKQRKETFEERLVREISDANYKSSIMTIMERVSIMKKNINMVMTKESVTEEEAFKAIRKNNWSVGFAIKELRDRRRTSEKEIKENLFNMEEMLLCDEEDVFNIEI